MEDSTTLSKVPSTLFAIADATKVVDAIHDAREPEVTKDPYAKTAGVGNHEQLKHEYVCLPTGIFSDSIDVHGMS